MLRWRRMRRAAPRLNVGYGLFATLSRADASSRPQCGVRSLFLLKGVTLDPSFPKRDYRFSRCARKTPGLPRFDLNPGYGFVLFRVLWLDLPTGRHT